MIRVLGTSIYSADGSGDGKEASSYDESQIPNFITAYTEL